ncbi:hypothetical protein [Halobellus marinus]|uniref:hypothetical protein n=1 Tax=Halobellus sp. GCM10025813 TaxID=3252665 RepID=UPI003618961E
MGLIRSGKSDEELREERREEKLHQMNLSANEADRPMDTAYINEMTNHQLQEPTVDKLSNLLDQDFMLGNLNDAEVHEYRWLARVMRLEIEALHPHPDSVFQGDVRAAAFDDEEAAIEPLSEKDKAIIEQFLMAVISRATRGRDGWQQEMFNKTISASETRDVGGDDDDGFLP